MRMRAFYFARAAGEGGAHLAGVVPGEAETAGDGSSTEEADDREDDGDHDWGPMILAGPKFAERAYDARGVRVEGALVPTLVAGGEFRVVANGVEGGLEDAVFPGLSVLRHEEDMAAALAANLVDKAGKVGGVSQVEIGVRLYAVAVAAGDDELVPARGQIGDLAVLFPVAEAVELKGVDELAVDSEEVVDEDFVGVLADAIEIPEGMIEDEQDVRELVELSQGFREGGPGRARRWG